MQDTAVIMRAVTSSHSSQHLTDTSIDPSSDPSLAGETLGRRLRLPSTSELSDRDSGISSKRSSNSSMGDSHCECQGHASEVNAQNDAADRDINELDEDGGREYGLDLESHSKNTDEDQAPDDNESTPYFGPPVDPPEDPPIEDLLHRLKLMEEELHSSNEDLSEMGPGQKRSKNDDCETNSQSHTQSKRPAMHPSINLSHVIEFSDDENQNSGSQRFRSFGSSFASHNSNLETRFLGCMQKPSTSAVHSPNDNFYGQCPAAQQVICGPPSFNGRQSLQSKSSSSSSVSDLSDHVVTDGEALDIIYSLSYCMSPSGTEMPAITAQEIESAGLDAGGGSLQFAATLNCNDIRQTSVSIRNTDLYQLQTEQPFVPLNPLFVDSQKNTLLKDGLSTHSFSKSDYSSPETIVRGPPSVLCSSSMSSPMSSPPYSNRPQSPQEESLRSSASLASPTYSRLLHSPQGSLKCSASLASTACSSLSQSSPVLSPNTASPRSHNYSLPPTPASTDSESQGYITGTQSDMTVLYSQNINPQRPYSSSVVFPVHFQRRQDTSLETFQDIHEIEEVVEETESEDEQAFSLTDSPLPPHLYHILWDVNGHWRKDDSGETFLHSLAGLNEDVAVTNLSNMRGLSEFEVAINGYNKAKETPVYCAVCLQKYQLVKAFGEVGANVNTECCHHDKAHMPIHRAVEHSDIKMVSTLLDSFPYIDINARRPYDKLTALMVALLKHGTAVGTQHENITAAIVKRLFEYTVKHDISGLKIVDPKNGKTPLMMAVETKDLRIVSHFLTHINDVDKTRELINMQSKSGNSALHLAAGLRGLNDEVKGHMLRRLIMAGGDTNKKNIEGETPKDWARNIRGRRDTIGMVLPQHCNTLLCRDLIPQY